MAGCGNVRHSVVQFASRPARLRSGGHEGGRGEFFNSPLGILEDLGRPSQEKYGENITKAG